MPRSASSEKRAEWRERLRRFARSKLPVAEFCRRERVSVPSLYQWRRKLADSAPAQLGRSPATASFIPVQVAAAGGLQVNFPNGVQLTLPTADAHLVRLSIEAIAQAHTRPGEA